MREIDETLGDITDLVHGPNRPIVGLCMEQLKVGCLQNMLQPEDLVFDAVLFGHGHDVCPVCVRFNMCIMPWIY